MSIGPRADFSCNSKKCRTEDGAAPVYELPVGASRCPVCGSKRITRLFNRIAVVRGAAPDRDPRLTSSSHLVRSGALLRGGFDHHDAHKAGYTPPRDDRGYPVEDRARYSKLESYAASAEDLVTVAEPGKGRPLTPMEIMRERRTDKGGVAATLAALSGVGIPTAVRGTPKDDA